MLKMITGMCGEINIQLAVTDEKAKEIATRHAVDMIDFHENLVIFGKPMPGYSFDVCFSIHRRDDGQMVIEISEFEPHDKLDGVNPLPLDDLDFILSCAEKFRHILGVNK